jgi:hypothetical protein
MRQNMKKSVEFPVEMGAAIFETDAVETEEGVA